MPFGNRYAMPADNQFIAKEKTVPADPRCCRSRSWRIIFDADSGMPSRDRLQSAIRNLQSVILHRGLSSVGRAPQWH